jgi:hypothetical protein
LIDTKYSIQLMQLMQFNGCALKVEVTALNLLHDTHGVKRCSQNNINNHNLALLALTNLSTHTHPAAEKEQQNLLIMPIVRTTAIIPLRCI